jgi:hypothetical protein
MPGRFYPRVGPYHGRYVSFTGYQPDKASIARLAVGPEIHHAVSNATGQTRAHAQSIAPSNISGFPDSVKTGYLTAFKTDVLIVEDIPFRVRGEPMARWSGRVVNDDKWAIFVEVGNSSRPGAYVMRGSLEWAHSAFD